MTAGIKHEDQTNAASRGHLLLQRQEWHMAADGKGCAREDCHSLCTEYEPGICAFLFSPMIGRRVIHSMRVYENISHFLLSSGVGGFTQLQAMAFLPILTCHFLPPCWISFTYATCPRSVPAHAALMVRAAGGDGDVPWLSRWRHRRELHQMWDVPGTFVAGCKCHPWSLESACWFASQVAIAERREIQQLRHSLLLLNILRRYF